MVVDGEALKQLRQSCEVSEKAGRAALARSGGDAAKALRSLIVAGEVERDQLDPLYCSEELWVLAQLRQTILRRQEDPVEARQWEERRPLNDLLAQLKGAKPLDKQTLAAGQMFRDLALRKSNPELDYRDPLVTWRHPVFGRFTCKHGLITGKVTVRGFARFGRPKRPPLMGVNFLARKNADAPPPALVDLLTRTIGNAESLAKKICRALWDDLRGRGPGSGMWWHGQLQEVNAALPKPLASEADVAAALRPYDLTVHTRRTGAVEINFHSTFEEEHGVGVLTNGTKVIGIGYSGDVAPFANGRARKKL